MSGRAARPGKAHTRQWNQARSLQVDHDLIDVAPTPVFARLCRRNDGVPGRPKMLRSMAIPGIVAAADVTAVAAQSQVHPRVPGPHAFLATGCVALSGSHRIKMGT